MKVQLRKILNSKIFDYKVYWNNRYKNKGNSGKGSYDELAYFKAETINTLLIENNINSVIEFGCGDGNNLKLMDIAIIWDLMSLLKASNYALDYLKMIYLKALWFMTQSISLIMGL